MNALTCWRWTRSVATRSELTAAIVERYRVARRDDKGRILDEFVAVTGYHRKHAIRVLGRREKKPSGNKSHSLRYGSDVRQALRHRSGCAPNGCDH